MTRRKICSGTDHTPGYGSAAKDIATVTKELVSEDGLIYEMQSVRSGHRNHGKKCRRWLTGAAVTLPRDDEDCEGGGKMPGSDLSAGGSFRCGCFSEKVKKLVDLRNSPSSSLFYRKVSRRQTEDMSANGSKCPHTGRRM